MAQHPEIVDGIDISDFPEHIKVKMRIPIKKRKDRREIEDVRDMSGASISLKQLWDKIDQHMSYSYHEKIGDLPKHIKACSTQYTSRLKDNRKPQNKVKEYVSPHLYNGIKFKTEDATVSVYSVD